MALVKDTLKEALASVFSQTNDPSVAAEAIATAIDAYIKTATVTTTVVGTSVSGGAVTGTGTGTLS